MKISLKLPPLWENAKAKTDQLRAIRDHRRISIMATGTKVGKTLGCAIWIVEHAILKPGSLWWWVAPYRRTGKIGWRRIRSLIPAELIAHVDNAELTLDLINGSRIEVRTAEIPGTLFGEAVSGAVVDEGGRVREESWNAVYTTLLQTQGPIRIAGNTDRGRRNWFYRLFIQGKSGLDPEVGSHHIRSTEAPHFMPGGNPGPLAIDRMRTNLSNVAYRALVLAEFPEDAATVFPGLQMALIDAVDAMPPPALYPPVAGHRYVGGLDVGKRNSSVLTHIDVENRTIAFWERYRDVGWIEQKRRITGASAAYDAIVVIDATKGSVGDPMFDDLISAGVRGVPFGFTGQSKPPLIEALAMAIERREILIPRSLTGLIAELEAFEREVTEAGNVKYHAPTDDDEMKDDAVISLALANWELRGYPRQRPKPSERPKVSARKNQEQRRVRGGAKRKGFL